MTCLRCEGLMVIDRFDDLQDDTGQNYFQAWHCLVCGEVIDPVIILNRQNHSKPFPNRNRKIMAYH